MEQQHFDLVVIGGGPGGYGTALYATSAGLNVALVEKDVLGGVETRFDAIREACDYRIAN